MTFFQVLAKSWGCTGCKKRLNQNGHCHCHINDVYVQVAKLRWYVPLKKIIHIMKSTEKVFYGGRQKI